MTPETLNEIIIHELDQLKAQDILSIDVRTLTHLSDYMIICTATSSRHCESVFENLVQALKFKGVKPFRTDHQRKSDWVIADYADVIVHIMLQDAREFYSLEKLWFQDESTAAISTA